MSENRIPALTASVLLHGGLAALALLALPHVKLPELPPQAVPVTVVSRAPDRPPPAPAAVAAPEPEPAQAEAVAPAPEPPAPVPVPIPAPPPVARATPVPPVPRPPPPLPVAKVRPRPDLDLGKLAASLPIRPARPTQPLDLGALASSLPSTRANRSLDLAALTATLPRAAARGPARAETAPQARAAQGLSADELGALRAKLIRLWNLNCSVEGADSVIARVRMRLAPDGSLAGAPELIDTSGDAPPAVTQAAGARALSAVARGAPYTEIPRERLKTLNDFVFRFDAKQACR